MWEIKTGLHLQVLEATAPMSEAAAAPAPAPPMSEAEARRLAEAEGLQLVPSSSNPTGFRGVACNGSKSKPFKAQAQHDGRTQFLGRFASPAEAALAFARHLGGPASIAAAAAAAGAPAPAPPMSEAEFFAAAAAPPPPTSSGKRRADASLTPAPKRRAACPGPVRVDERGGE